MCWYPTSVDEFLKEGQGNWIGGINIPHTPAEDGTELYEILVPYTESYFYEKPQNTPGHIYEETTVISIDRREYLEQFYAAHKNTAPEFDPEPQIAQLTQSEFEELFS